MTYKKSISNAAERQRKYRQEQAKLGRRGRLYYLTDGEKGLLDKYLCDMREKENGRDLRNE